MENKSTSTFEYDMLNTTGASIDANYGPWTSTAEYEEWMAEELGIEDIPAGVTIAVKATDGTITKYIREKNAWRVDGGASGATTWDELQGKPSTFTPSAHTHDDYQPAGSYAAADHNHDAKYQAKGSYAQADHNHDGVYQPAGSYAAADHNHDAKYQAKGSYAQADHTHDGVYQPKGNYAAADHNHDDYATNIASLMAKVFPLTVSYASKNNGTFEVGTSVTPTATANITRQGSDVSGTATLEVTAPTTGVTVSGKTWTGTAISSGSVTYKARVTQGGQTALLPDLTYAFTYYRYRGILTSEPTDYPAAIKALAKKELSTDNTLGETSLNAGEYYLFAVKGTHTFTCVPAKSEGTIEGCVTGTCTIAQENNSSLTNTYSYILVPASKIAWSFKIV